MNLKKIFKTPSREERVQHVIDNTILNIHSSDQKFTPEEQTAIVLGIQKKQAEVLELKLSMLLVSRDELLSEIDTTENELTRISILSIND